MTTTNDTGDFSTINALLPGQALVATSLDEDLTNSFTESMEEKLSRLDTLDSYDRNQVNLGAFVQAYIEDWENSAEPSDTIEVELRDGDRVLRSFEATYD